MKDYSVFISYSRKHRFNAKTFADALSNNANFSVWIDDRIGSGELWSDAIDYALHNSFALIVIVTPEAMSSINVAYEWASAIAKGIPVFPITFSSLDKSDMENIPYPLERRQIRDFSEATLTNEDIVFFTFCQELKNQYGSYLENQAKSQSLIQIDKLAEMLQSASPDERIQGIRIAAASHIDELFELVKQNINFDDDDVRFEAVRNLWELNPERAASILVGYLDKEGIVRETAFEILSLQLPYFYRAKFQFDVLVEVLERATNPKENSVPDIGQLCSIRLIGLLLRGGLDIPTGTHDLEHAHNIMGQCVTLLFDFLKQENPNLVGNAMIALLESGISQPESSLFTDLKNDERTFIVDFNESYSKSISEVFSQYNLAYIKDEFTQNITKLREERSSLQVRQKTLTIENKEMTDRIKRLEHTEIAICPLCEQSLTLTHTTKLLNELKIEGKLKKEEYRFTVKRLIYLDNEILSQEKKLAKLR